MFFSHIVLNLAVATLLLFISVRYQVDLMAGKKNRKSKCIFFDFFFKNLEIALKQSRNNVEVVKVITFIRGVYKINNFIESQLY